jgi:hypothetical protein
MRTACITEASSLPRILYFQELLKMMTYKFPFMSSLNYYLRQQLKNWIYIQNTEKMSWEILVSRSDTSWLETLGSDLHASWWGQTWSRQPCPHQWRFAVQLQRIAHRVSYNGVLDLRTGRSYACALQFAIHSHPSSCKLSILLIEMCMWLGIPMFHEKCSEVSRPSPRVIPGAAVSWGLACKTSTPPPVLLNHSPTGSSARGCHGIWGSHKNVTNIVRDPFYSLAGTRARDFLCTK